MGRVVAKTEAEAIEKTGATKIWLANVQPFDGLIWFEYSRAV